MSVKKIHRCIRLKYNKTKTFSCTYIIKKYILLCVGVLYDAPTNLKNVNIYKNLTTKILLNYL